MRGPRHGRWNRQGRAVDQLGYVRVRVGRDHRLAQHSGGWAYEHLVVWCAAGNRPPGRKQVIHHRNGVKTDNRIENLACVTRGDHTRGHANRRAAE